MELASYSNSFLSLLAPIVAIGLAVITRKVVISLGAGILVGALLLNEFSVAITFQYITDVFISIFWDDGLNTGSIFLLSFLLLLGGMTSLITLAGGTGAFADWARERIKTRQGSQVLAVALGFIIFIDDYFNSLAVGQISRPITDGQRISRAKLAYLIDSTAAPICVLTPISSWGAYIIALIGSILVAHEVTDISALGAFVTMIPMNLYAFLALILVVCSAAMDINVGAMKTHDQKARQGELFDEGKGRPMGSSELEALSGGQVKDLIVPVVVLVLATVFALIWTGASVLAAEGQPFSLLGAFENCDVNTSLVTGGLIGIGTSIVMLLRQRPGASRAAGALISGFRSMMPAIYILVLAWILVDVISGLETGKYLAGLVSDSIEARWLPAILFVVAGVMAFATGTSWGTFGIMLPIAGDMAAGTEIALMLPMLAAVLAGAVFGDHCSPISDTTILSSTGAACHHIDHVVTQLPYCLSAAGVALSGYIVMGLTNSAWTGVSVALVMFVGVVIFLKRCSERVEEKMASDMVSS